jgi:hypothetical protein
MKGITGSPQKAAWLQSELETRPIEQERMARARFELTLSLDAMISLEEKRDVNVFPPYPTFASNLGSICKEFSGPVVRWAAGHIHIFDRRSRALVQAKQKRRSLSNQEALFSCHIRKFCSRLSTSRVQVDGPTALLSPTDIFCLHCPRRLPMTWPSDIRPSLWPCDW